MARPSPEDRLDVIETCTRFGWHADQREWDRFAEVLTDVLYLDYTALAGGEPGDVKSADLIASWKELFGRLTTTQHLITNHLVDVDGDSAVCTAQFHAHHVAAVAHGDQTMILSGHYRFGLVRAGDGWQINSLVMTPTWSTGNLAVLGIPG
ncbi:MAG TPA: nuclear transport factor 2 family protein [Streptosporangiaceae bacterium]|nr:nuclear transport factor 2 family protein [Streptosporangiaceae bacterium]